MLAIFSAFVHHETDFSLSPSWGRVYWTSSSSSSPVFPSSHDNSDQLKALDRIASGFEYHCLCSRRSGRFRSTIVNPVIYPQQHSPAGLRFLNDYSRLHSTRWHKIFLNLNHESRYLICQWYSAITFKPGGITAGVRRYSQRSFRSEDLAEQNTWNIFESSYKCFGHVSR